MKNASIPIIDCDIHPSASEACPLSPFIPRNLKVAIAQNQGSTPGHGYANPFGVTRRDASCNSYAELEAFHLSKFNIAYGVIQSPGLAVSVTHNHDVANALAYAWNEWQIENYLNKDPRLLGSIAVNMNDPQAAVREINRCAQNKQMVQVLVTGESERLYGHRSYYPIYEACVANKLVFVVHPGNEGSISPSTPVGRASSYFEWHCGIPLTYQAHLISMVAEGVFEKFADLKFMVTEGGISWLPHVMWRMDKNFKALRSTTPWLREPPSKTIIEHVRLTTQPIEEPANSNHLLQIFDMINAAQTVCFSSDFPHWDFDDPIRAFPRNTSTDLLERIFYKSSCELFQLQKNAPILEYENQVTE